jgi:hypothetical protein
MMGGKTPETCWAVDKIQDNKLENCCIWLVIYLNWTMMHGLTNLQNIQLEVWDLYFSPVIIKANNMRPVSTQWTHSEHTVSTQWTQSEHTVNTQWAHSEHTVSTQWTHSEHTVSTQWAHSEHTVNTQWAHSEHTVNTQWAHSEHILEMRNVKNVSVFIPKRKCWLNRLRSRWDDNTKLMSNRAWECNFVYFNSKSQQDAHVIEFIFIWRLHYMFRVSLSPIFRSTKQL